MCGQCNSFVSPTLLVMRAVIQRVKRASITVDNNVIGKIERGLLVLVGVCPEDTEEDCLKLSKKVCSLRLWPDPSETSQWKQSVVEIGGKVLCVSQFTLYAKVSKGAKPDFHGAAKSEQALALYDRVRALIGSQMPNGMHDVGDGQFGAMMDVELVNDGPVTIDFDTKGR